MSDESQREKDMKRRARSRRTESPEPGRRIPWRPLAGVATVVVAIALLATLWPDEDVEPVGDGEAAVGLAAFNVDDDPFLGDPTSRVALVGYESPHCSSCKAFHQGVLPDLRAEFFDAGRAVYYYVQGTIGGDQDSSIAQECAALHGGNAAFWDLTDRFYARANTYSTPDLRSWLGALADEHGFDRDAVLACFDDQETLDAVSEDLRVGRDQGARGTPSFWVIGHDGEAVKVASGQVRQALAEAIEAASAASVEPAP